MHIDSRTPASTLAALEAAINVFASHDSNEWVAPVFFCTWAISPDLA
jgi:hypothetical protein